MCVCVCVCVCRDVCGSIIMCVGISCVCCDVCGHIMCVCRGGSRTFLMMGLNARVGKIPETTPTN